MLWLVLCRGLQGIGGGGVIQIVQIIIADITTLSERGKFTGGAGAVWGLASVLGPVVGGAIIDVSIMSLRPLFPSYQQPSNKQPVEHLMAMDLCHQSPSRRYCISHPSRLFKSTSKQA